MSRRRPLHAILLALGVLLAAQTAAAQTQPPLKATIFFQNPPANLTFDPLLSTPAMTIILQLENTSGAPVLTTIGFSATEFWRNLYFTHESGAIATNTAAAELHADPRVGACLSRRSVLQVPIALQVVPVEVLAGPPDPFALEFAVDQVFKRFPDIKAPGRWTVDARVHVLTYTTGGAIITDCDQFPDTTLADVGAAAAVSRQEFAITSNQLEFFVQGLDVTPPTTTVLQSPAPNGAGWNNQNVALAFTATDNVGGSGVNRIVVSVGGAQTTIAGAGGTVNVAAEGTTTVTFSAVDNENNAEPARSLTVRIDRTPPVVTPPANVTVAATEPGGARGVASPALAAFLAGATATDNLSSPTPLAPRVGGSDVDNTYLFPLGTTTVTFRFQDAAGNIGSATATVTVTAEIGTPEIIGAIAGSGVQQGRVFFYDLRFTNNGTGLARGVTLQRFVFKTLSGNGNVTYNPSVSPKLPIALGDLAVGASTTIRVFLTVPTAVKQFSITESGQFVDPAGSTIQFSIQQVVSP